MADVEIRKVQRLGASSLVVTLPHSWAKRVGLKPGDSVIVSVEGSSLKLTPLSATANPRQASLDLEKLGDHTALSYILPCFYILGYDEVSLKVRDRSVTRVLKSYTSKLPGLELIDSGGEVLSAKVLIDRGKVDVKVLIKNMALLVSSSLRVLERISRGEPLENLRGEVAALAEEAYRVRSLIERQLHLYIPGLHGGELRSESIVLILSTLTLLSLIVSLIHDTIEVVGGKLRASEELARVAVDLGELIPLVGSNVASPSVKRSLELLVRLTEIRRNLLALIEQGALEGLQYVVASRLLDFLKILQIICYAALCVGLASGVET